MLLYSLISFDTGGRISLNFAWLSSLHMSAYWVIALFPSLASDLDWIMTVFSLELPFTTVYICKGSENINFLLYKLPFIVLQGRCL